MFLDLPGLGSACPLNGCWGQSGCSSNEALWDEIGGGGGGRRRSSFLDPSGISQETKPKTQLFIVGNARPPGEAPRRAELLFTDGFPSGSLSEDPYCRSIFPFKSLGCDLSVPPSPPHPTPPHPTPLISIHLNAPWCPLGPEPRP
ncbi:hypothetical protein Q8A73_011197 [Channa argus]|nr:hypothetical protein Q8A73_011197 [Channa argus]